MPARSFTPGSTRSLMRLLLALAAWLVLGVAAPTALAQEGSRLSVVVWLKAETDASLLERIRGQTSDLDVDISAVHAGPVQGDLQQRFTFAAQLARRHRANVVVWFRRPEPGADRVVVHFADPRHHRILVRRLGGGEQQPEAGLSSATLEAAALVIREALRALAAGATIGVEAPPEPTPTKPAPPVPKPTGSECPPKPQPRTEDCTCPVWYGALSWEVVLDGAAPFGHQGTGLRLGPRFGWVELSLFLHVSVPSSIDNDYGAIRLSRHAAGLWGGLRLPLSRSVDWGAGFRLGFAGYQRETSELGPGVASSPDRFSPSLLLGPEIHLGWAPTSGPLQLVLAAGLDLVPAAPRVGYEVDGRFEPVLSPWRVHPRFALGGEIQLGR